VVSRPDDRQAMFSGASPARHSSPHYTATARYQHQGFRIIGTAKRHARINGRFVDEVLVERFL
jgi:RimJ/RimL family protein N-acetyltransferase